MDSKAFWSQKNIYVGVKYCFYVRSAYVGIYSGRLLCLCSNYHNSLSCSASLPKSLVSYRPYTFLFLRLSIRCRSCIFHSCFFHCCIFSAPYYYMYHIDCLWTSAFRSHWTLTLAIHDLKLQGNLNEPCSREWVWDHVCRIWQSLIDHEW